LANSLEIPGTKTSRETRVLQILSEPLRCEPLASTVDGSRAFLWRLADVIGERDVMAH